MESNEWIKSFHVNNQDIEEDVKINSSVYYDNGEVCSGILSEYINSMSDNAKAEQLVIFSNEIDKFGSDRLKNVLNIISSYNLNKYYVDYNILFDKIYVALSIERHIWMYSKDISLDALITIGALTPKTFLNRIKHAIRYSWR